MSKYIKQDDIFELVRTGRLVGNSNFESVCKAVGSLPTIEIVNCIECAYLGDDWWCYKHEFTPIPIEDYFCKGGERKDYE